jgi:hypothetical protein
MRPLGRPHWASTSLREDNMATTPANPPPYIVDQYKSYIGDLGNIGTRYTTAQTFYLSIITAVLGVLAIKNTDPDLNTLLTPVFVAAMLFIAAVCAIWRKTLLFYSGMFLIKFTVLRQIEQQWDLFRIYHEEDALFHKNKVPRLITHEAKLPLVIGSAAVILAGVAVIYLVQHR